MKTTCRLEAKEERIGWDVKLYITEQVIADILCALLEEDFFLSCLKLLQLNAF